MTITSGHSREMALVLARLEQIEKEKTTVPTSPQRITSAPSTPHPLTPLLANWPQVVALIFAIGVGWRELTQIQHNQTSMSSKIERLVDQQNTFNVRITELQGQTNTMVRSVDRAWDWINLAREQILQLNNEMSAVQAELKINREPVTTDPRLHSIQKPNR